MSAEPEDNDAVVPMRGRRRARVAPNASSGPTTTRRWRAGSRLPVSGQEPPRLTKWERERLGERACVCCGGLEQRTNADGLCPACVERQ